MPEIETPAADTSAAEETTTSVPELTEPAVETVETEKTTETTAAAGPEQSSRAKLEATIREKLDAFNADEETDVLDPDDRKAAGTKTPKEPAQPAEAAAEETPAPTLPAAHVRSLKAFGLTDGEIAKTTPEVAAALHARRNQEITRWAEEGRRAKVQPQAPAAVPPPVAQATKPFDIAALKQQYGDEPLIAALEAQQKEIESFRTYREQAAQQIEHQKLQTLGRQIDGFFSAKELAPYHATYGTEAVKATDEQLAKRSEVLSLADAIIGGARAQGVNLTLDQALQHAFDSVSAPQAKTAARQEIKKELTARNKGLTLKPGGQAKPKPANSRSELEKNVREKLKALST